MRVKPNRTQGKIVKYGLVEEINGELHFTGWVFDGLNRAIGFQLFTSGRSPLLNGYEIPALLKIKRKLKKC